MTEHRKETSLHHFICQTCGTQFAESAEPPAHCPICEDARQYVPSGGQQWTTLGKLWQNHENRLEPLEPGLFGIGTEPAFAIGQRALLVQTDEGNVLWDCITLLDDDTARRVKALGGIDAIAISHPHYYASMVEWARTFDAPIHLHAADRDWVMRKDVHLDFWTGTEFGLPGGLTLHRLGGHFPGGQVLLWPGGADGRGALLSGDIVQVIPDAGWVSFMYSFPNHIPLPASAVERIASAIRKLRFDRIYGAWWNRVISSGGQAAVARSAERYVQALNGNLPDQETLKDKE